MKQAITAMKVLVIEKPCMKKHWPHNLPEYG
jgi:hypothetical protein